MLIVRLHTDAFNARSTASWLPSTNAWSTVEPWILLLLLGAVLLVVDWLTFSRRITV